MTVRDQIVAGARRWLGTPYVWGGESEAEGGVDCSGLVINAYAAAGHPLRGRPIASQIGQMGTSVSLATAQPGDVIYYDNPGPTDHVGIYLGGGQMIEAPYQGVDVRIRSVGTPTSVRRLLGAEEGGGVGGGGAAIDTSDWEKGTVGDAPGLLDELTTGWANDAMAIGIKVAAVIAAGALVVVGLNQTVK